MAFYIDAGKNGSSGEIAYLLKKCILHCPKRWTEIVFLCIGSDRVTGDCLGPYIGHLLTPHETGHALVIAIDASLGQKKHLGYVTIGNGALYPGAGVQKNLPPVGDIHITGIVNTAGLMDHLTLQTTRLSTVVALADVIAGGILKILPAEADLSASDPHSEHSHSALLHAHA